MKKLIEHQSKESKEPIPIQFREVYGHTITCGHGLIHKSMMGYSCCVCRANVCYIHCLEHLMYLKDFSIYVCHNCLSKAFLIKVGQENGYGGKINVEEINIQRIKIYPGSGNDRRMGFVRQKGTCPFCNLKLNTLKDSPIIINHLEENTEIPKLCVGSLRLCMETQRIIFRI